MHVLEQKWRYRRLTNLSKISQLRHADTHSVKACKTEEQAIEGFYIETTKSRHLWGCLVDKAGLPAQMTLCQQCLKALGKQLFKDI